MKHKPLRNHGSRTQPTRMTKMIHVTICGLFCCRVAHLGNLIFRTPVFDRVRNILWGFPDFGKGWRSWRSQRVGVPGGSWICFCSYRRCNIILFIIGEFGCLLMFGIFWGWNIYVEENGLFGGLGCSNLVFLVSQDDMSLQRMTSWFCLFTPGLLGLETAQQE